MEIARLLHLLGVVIWVGGMFFAYMTLRPAAAALLEPAQRLPLWQATLSRFFTWVWIAVALIIVSSASALPRTSLPARLRPRTSSGSAAPAASLS